jgi:hypothetical protein
MPFEIWNLTTFLWEACVWFAYPGIPRYAAKLLIVIITLRNIPAGESLNQVVELGGNDERKLGVEN